MTFNIPCGMLRKGSVTQVYMGEHLRVLVTVHHDTNTCTAASPVFHYCHVPARLWSKCGQAKKESVILFFGPSFHVSRPAICTLHTQSMGNFELSTSVAT